MPVPPSPDPVRRNARVGPKQLPAAGRQGPPPAFPLDDQTEREAALWTELWALPQATQWARLRWTRIVARYCRLVIESEGPEGLGLLSHLLALEDRLGLTPKAMRALLWEIAVDEVAERRDEKTSSARGRLKAVG